MRLGWCTDIHVSFITDYERYLFYKSLDEQQLDALLITGDIGEASNVRKHLKKLQSVVKVPVYFVYGNHDYYGTAVSVRRRYTMQRPDELIYLTKSGGIHLTGNTYLCGVDGFADARAGDFANSHIRLNDQNYIRELRAAARGNYLPQEMARLADIDAKLLFDQLTICKFKGAERIIVGTHIPPWEQLACYRGRQSDKNYTPFYVNTANGKVLEDFARQNPNIQIHLYCGHSHGASKYNPLPNLAGECGEAQYYRPALQHIIEV